MTAKANIHNLLAITAAAFLGAASRAGLAPDAQVKSTTEEVLAVMAKTGDAGFFCGLYWEYPRVILGSFSPGRPLNFPSPVCDPYPPLMLLWDL